MREDNVFNGGKRRKGEKEIERSLICMTEKVSEARRRQGREGEGGMRYQNMCMTEDHSE